MITFKMIKSIFKALVVITGALSFFTIALAQDLDLSLRSWKEARAELEILEGRKSLSIDELRLKRTLLNSEYEKRETYFRELAKSYIRGNLRNSDIDREFKNHSQYQKFMSHFSTILILESAKRLEESKNNEIQSFMKRYRSVYPENAIPLFRITGDEIKRDSPTEEKGGFHRGSQSIFMDITRIESGEWIFIFMHEVYHALDKKLHDAVVEFTDEELVRSIKIMVNKKNSLAELTSKETIDLDRFVTAGLDRNLFAEYRDWSFCFSLYEKGIEEGLWKKIPFVEDVLSFKDKNESMNAFVYRYLNERAGLSDENFLSKPLIRQKIAEKREQFNPK